MPQEGTKATLLLGRNLARGVRMGCGVPVAGLNSPEADSVLGEAAYLVPPGEARRLGAACLTLLVEEQVATALAQKGLARATAYQGLGPLEAWMRVFRSAAS